jgi:hypothetical protein
MDLTGILSISGHSGLFKLIKQSKVGLIVESLVDNKRMQTFASSKISTLDDIAIFTDAGEIQLKEVLRKIFTLEEGKQINLSVKSSNEELKVYFEKVLPDYDREKVYVSDIKKVVLWYNLLVEKGLVDLEEDKKEEIQSENENQDEKAETETENVEEKKTEKKAVKKAEIKEKSESETPKKKPVKKAKKEDTQ